MLPRYKRICKCDYREQNNFNTMRRNVTKIDNPANPVLAKRLQKGTATNGRRAKSEQARERNKKQTRTGEGGKERAVDEKG